MPARIRLSRRGKPGHPFYRIVVAHREKPRDGRFLEVLGTYDPRAKAITTKKERVEYWLSQGAQPSETVAQLLKRV